MPTPDHGARIDAIIMRLAHTELLVSKLESIVSALVDVVQAQREQHENDVDPRTERAARVAALEWGLAAAIGGPVTWNLALAVQMVISGESPTPAGYERLVAEIRRNYGRPPCVRTVWNHLQGHRRRLETSEPSPFQWRARW